MFFHISKELIIENIIHQIDETSFIYYRTLDKCHQMPYTNIDMPTINPQPISPLTVYLPEEAADKLRVERRTIYKLIEEGQLPKREFGKGYKLLGEDLLRYLGTPTIAQMIPDSHLEELKNKK